MIKKTRLFLIPIAIAALAAFLLTACTAKKEEPSQTGKRTYADYVDTGKRVAVQSGDVYGDVARNVLKAKETPSFAAVADMLASLRRGNVDAALLSNSYVKQLEESGDYPDVDYIMVPADVYVNKAAPIFYTTQLRDKYNEWFSGIAADGTWGEIVDRWLGGALPAQEDIPQFKLTGENGTLKMCSTGNFPPLIYYDAYGKLAGFDVDMMSRFAQHMKMDLKIEIMNYEAIIPYVILGKADMSACTVTVTDERGEVVIFGEPSVITPAVLIVPKTGGAPRMKSDVTSFWESIKTSFERNLIRENRWRLIAGGLRISLIITVFAFALATVLGFGVCWLRMSKKPVLRAIGDCYVTVLRGTPIVVLLMITFYVIFAKSSISSTTVAIIAFGVNGAAFVGEIIRSAILTVDKGQIEAARSMGFSKTGAFFTVTFPQAARVAFPVYMSEFISLFKMTSVVGYIAIVDLTKAGDIIRSRTYDAFFPLIMVALLYLIAASIMIWLLNLINNQTNKRLRRAK
jgi:polar amino acid transport system substrate-binding protein